MRKHLLVSVAAAVLVVGAAVRANAATLTIYDYYNGTNNTGPAVAATWTLDVATGCTTCAVTFSVNIPTGSVYIGKYLEAAGWVVHEYDVATVADVGYNDDGPGGAGAWSFGLSTISAGGCGSGGTQLACGDWVLGGVGDGYGPLAAGTYSWTFDTIFDTATNLTLPMSGNMRASFNTADQNSKTGKYQNYNIFSPADGSFDGGTTDGGGVDGGGAPEPGMLLLLGTGLVVAGARLRKRQ